MAWSLNAFTFRVQAAFDAGPRSAAPTWTDVTSDVMISSGFSAGRGRRNGYTRVGAGTGEITMRNWAETTPVAKVAGRWTPGVTAGPWNPLKLRRRVRVQVQYSGIWYDLWAGHITDFGPKFVGSAQAVCSLSLSDLLANLARTSLPTLMNGERLSDAPAVLYPLDDDASSSTAGDRSGADATVNLATAQLGTGGTLAFGVGAAPGPDAATVAAFTPGSGSYSATNGKYLTGSGLPIMGTWNGGATLTAAVRPGNLANAMVAVRAQSTGPDYIEIGVDATGKPKVTVQPFLATAVSVTAAAALTTTATSIITAVATYGGNVELFVNGASAGTAVLGANVPVPTVLYVGSNGTGALWDGQVSHVAAYASALSSARVLEQANARTGFTGERTDQRFARLCRLAGLPSGLYSAGTGLSTMCAQPIAGKSLPAALAEVEDAELGVVGIAADGSLKLYVRGTRYNAAVALTLDARTDVLNDLSGFVVNDEDLLNDLTVRRPGGATQRFINQASIDDNGTQDDDRTLYLADDNQAMAAGQWLINQRANPQPKAPTLRISLAAIAARSPASVPAVLGLDIGSRIQVTNLPAGAPASTVDLFVEGVDPDLSKGDLVFTLNTSNVARSGAVWQLDSTTYSVLDSTTRLAA